MIRPSRNRIRRGKRGSQEYVGASAQIHVELRRQAGEFIKNDPEGRGWNDLVNDALELFLASNVVSLPLLGNVAGGEPILAEENIEEYIPVPVRIVDNGDYVLTVRGDSMSPLIEDGDLIVVHHQQIAKKGEIVVARVGDEATVKRWYPGFDRAKLEPINRDYPTIETEDVEVLGRVVAIMRPV